MHQLTNTECKSIQGGLDTEQSVEMSFAIMFLSLCTCAMTGLIAIKWLLNCRYAENVLPL